MAPEDTRRLVLACGRTLVAGGHKPSVEEIAVASGISRATIYRLFGSRDEVLAALDVERDPGTRTKILDAAVELLGRDGLARLSMNELAQRAGVSRASLYRIFPGKPALFREVLKGYSPLEPVMETLESMPGRPAAEVMPAIARAAAASFEGRIGILRGLLFEMTGLGPDTGEAVGWAMGRALGPLLSYVGGEMAAGRLRPMHPLLALQSFIGPIFFHLITRELAIQRLGLELEVQEAVTELADSWVRAMQPEEAEE